MVCWVFWEPGLSPWDLLHSYAELNHLEQKCLFALCVQKMFCRSKHVRSTSLECQYCSLSVHSFFALIYLSF